MIGWLRDNLKEVEVSCANKKCQYYKNRFVVKYDKNLINQTVKCPECNMPIIISKIYFKRKNMK